MAFTSRHDATLPKLVVCSRIAATQHLCGEPGAAPIQSLVSIGDPGTDLPVGHERARQILRLEFYDTGWSDTPFAPSARHVQSVVDFAPLAAELGGTCIVHCEAGVSRSPATAIVLLAALLASGQEDRAVQAVLQCAPHALPNGLVIRRGDEILRCDGALCRAVTSAFGRSPLV
jgi:predicted protein tyrosine phosphatase